jgi:hypothetical protein
VSRENLIEAAKVGRVATISVKAQALRSATQRRQAATRMVWNLTNGNGSTGQAALVSPCGTELDGPGGLQGVSNPTAALTIALSLLPDAYLGQVARY